MRKNQRTARQRYSWDYAPSPREPAMPTAPPAATRWLKRLPGGEPGFVKMSERPSESGYAIPDARKSREMETWFRGRTGRECLDERAGQAPDGRSSATKNGS